MNWEATLTDIFAAFVNQQTLEEGAQEMIFVSETDDLVHREYLSAIDGGIDAARSGNTNVIAIVNRSGYRVNTIDAALEMLLDLRKIYIDKYAAATGRIPPL